MENGKLKTENGPSGSDRREFSAGSFPISAEKVCSACGASLAREFAKFCRVCGKLLREDYQPLDTIRASYRLQGKSFQFEAKPSKEELIGLFETNTNSGSELARAFVVYSLVPYLGILFCPGAIVMGGIGVYMSYRNPYQGGGRDSFYSIALGLVTLTIQLLLWWLLYLIPELQK